jgi:hypothetical protein
MTPKRADYRMVDEADPQWQKFWAAYPRRCSKKDARKAWLEVDPSPETVDKMVEALAWQSQQQGWVKDDGAYIPHPASWLRAERWDDEPPFRLQLATVPNCPHTPPCRNENACAHAVKYPNGFPMQIVKVAK